jgi:hypothetical protein
MSSPLRDASDRAAFDKAAFDHDALERRLHRTFQALPPHRAPVTLEARVLAEIGRRAALPWWRASFRHWPAGVRAGFLVAALSAAAGIVFGAMTFGPGLGTLPIAGALLGRWDGLASIRASAQALGGAGVALGRAIPPDWLYGAAAGLACAYAALIALGAATYRTLSSGRIST